MNKKIYLNNFTLNVNFNLRQTTPANALTAINAVIRFNNQRVVISGIDKVEPRYWNTEKQKPTQNAANDRAKQISKNISNASAVITDIFEKYTALHKRYPEDIKDFQDQCRRRIFDLPEQSRKSTNDIKSANFLQYLKDFRDALKAGKRIISTGKRKGQSYAPNTYKQYGNLITNIESYMIHARIDEISFNDIDLDFYTSFREYCVVKHGKTPGYFGTLVKCIKTAMNDASEYGFHTSRKHKSRNFIKESAVADTIFLDNDKLDKLFSLDLSSNPKLNKTRDLFLIGAYSGLRFSDFSTIRPQDISGDYIRVKTIKTGERVTIPITKNLRSILDKYNGMVPEPISNQKFNSYLKDLGDHAEFRETINITKYINGTECIVGIPFWKLMSSHTARRSFATNMFKLGIPSILIMAITGHTTEKAFLTYIKMNNDDKAAMMLDMIRRSELKVVTGDAI